MIAALAMYDWPGMQAANDRFWCAVASQLAEHGIAAPERLTRDQQIDAVWRRPDLFIAQTCGMPYVSGRCGAAVLVGRPNYGLDGARDGTYRSAIVARSEAIGRAGAEALLTLQGQRVAVNGWGSYSGHVTLRAHLAELRDGADTPFFGAALLSGGHLSSARMVAQGAADVAALDWVAWELLQIHEPSIAAPLTLVDCTAPAPILPFITAPDRAAQAGDFAAALDAAARALPPVTGVPRAVSRTYDADFDATRAAVRCAAAEKFAPEAPDLSDFHAI